MYLWDQHCCLPLDPAADVSVLRRFQEAGAGHVSVNVGYAPHDAAASLGLLAAFRASVARQPDLALAHTAADVLEAAGAGKLAVTFDLEDSNPLDGRLDLVEQYYGLGVRSLIPTYNHRNAAGSGCLDTEDGGLSPYGRALVAEMNRVGMVVDGSHCSDRTGLDLCEASTQPVVYSHSGLRRVWEHERNITDEQALACARTGGVIGINGVGIFLGANDASVDAMVRHIDYAVELLGYEHVGIGSDFPFDHEDFNRELARNPHLFSESYRRWGDIEFLPPEGLALLPAALEGRGYPPEAVDAVLSGNFLRVANQVWRESPVPAPFPADQHGDEDRGGLGEGGA